ncbi:MAG: hypothetical protein AAFP19_03575 [Bacteroidota bacterium]
MSTYTGMEGGPNIAAPPNALSFDFSRETIEQLLNKAHPNKAIAGLRFHFDTDGPINTPKRLIGIGVTQGGPQPEEVFTPGSQDYIPDTGNPITRQDFETLIFGVNGQKVRACVYFSRTVLRDQILNANNQRTGIRFFVAPFLISHTTLTAIGLNGNMMDGNFFRSELPCPPACGGDYRNTNFS